MSTRFEILKNGERVCIPGINGDGVLSVGVTYVKHPEQALSHDLQIGGLGMFDGSQDRRHHAARLWQLLGLQTWLCVELALLFGSNWPLIFRIGLVLVLAGLVLTVGRPLFPRPPNREHVENETTLHNLADALLFGLPALGLLMVGFSMLMYNLIFGCFVALAFMTYYWVSLFQRKQLQ